MAINTHAPIEQVAGRVEATNPKGIKVGGRWFNWSQYGPALPRPERGRHVRLEAKSGFIRGIEVHDDAAPDAPESPTAGRETVITRLAV